MKFNRNKIFGIVAICILVTTACQGINSDTENEALIASGTLAAYEVKISSEIGGLIEAIYADEGDSVKQGDSLFTVDDAIFQAEKKRAQAGLSAAEAGMATTKEQVVLAEYQYMLVFQQLTSAERAMEAQFWMIRKPDQIDMPVWYFQKNEVLEIVEDQVIAAEGRLNNQLSKLQSELDTESNKDFLVVEKDLHSKQIEFELALYTLNKAKAAADNDYLLDAAQEAYDAVLASLESAQLAYERELNTRAAEDILEARAKVAAAQSDLDYARDRLVALQVGNESLAVASARAGVALAEAGVVQARAMVDQALAGLEVLFAQEEKLSTESPVDGIILSLNIMEGEITGPGSTLMTVASLEELELTVYISEENYGQIDLGQIVEIQVNSFPESIFDGVVISIADEAEFTPRNVQTVAGRKTTVFAIKINVENPSGKLKPGMPADVSFE